MVQVNVVSKSEYLAIHGNLLDCFIILMLFRYSCELTRRVLRQYLVLIMVSDAICLHSENGNVYCTDRQIKFTEKSMVMTKMMIKYSYLIDHYKL